jgi:hypothetical protein
MQGAGCGRAWSLPSPGHCPHSPGIAALLPALPSLAPVPPCPVCVRGRCASPHRFQHRPANRGDHEHTADLVGDDQRRDGPARLLLCHAVCLRFDRRTIMRLDNILVAIASAALRSSCSVIEPLSVFREDSMTRDCPEEQRAPCRAGPVDELNHPWRPSAIRGNRPCAAPR